MVPYAATTEDITVTVRPIYLDSQSDFFEKRFVFGYFVEILNNGYEEVQLMRRHWYIRDAEGKVEEVEGAGVIGEQPLIAPGETHAYSSYCVLHTLEGAMKGHYTMERPRGERFRVIIPRFDLRAHAN